MVLLCLAFTTFSAICNLRNLSVIGIVCCQFLAATLVSAQESNFFLAEMQLSKTSIALPETFDVELTLTYPKEYSVNAKALQENLLSSYTIGESPFKILSETIQKTSGDINTQTFSYTLQPQIPGRFPITFSNIDFFSPSSSKSQVQLFSDIKYIEVTLPEVSRAIDMPIAQPVDLNERMPLMWDEMAKSDWLKQHALAGKKNFPWLICFGLVALYLAAFLTKLPRKSIKPPELKSKVNESQARATLAKILANKELSSEQGATYIYFLVQWVRYAFEEKLHVPATTQTSEEFLQKMQVDTNTNEHMAGRLRDFLQKADNIKFAKGSPTTADCQALIYQAKEIVSEISESS